MKFDVYFPFVNKQGVKCPGVKPHRKSWDEILLICGSEEHKKKIDELRAAASDKKKYAELKKDLAAVCFVGDCSKTRAIKFMKPTGLYMIDIDHCDDPIGAFKQITEEMGEAFISRHLLFGHITPSGKGLRFVLRAQPGTTSLESCMEWFNKTFDLKRFGDFDAPCKDFSRLSFLPKAEDFLYQNEDLLKEVSWNDGQLENEWEENNLPHLGGEMKNEKLKVKNEGELLFSDAETIDNFTDEEIQEYEAYEYRGTLLKTIIAKWVDVKGEPGKGEVHNYYNDMVKNFRNIVSNNKRALLYLLPRFGHDAEECWSSIKSITKVSSLSQLPKPFYFFLKDNGFYKSNRPTGSLAEYMLADDEEEKDADGLPWLPPVFREWVRISPKDFQPSIINALLPVLGTLASYLQAPYYYDGRMHTPSFFSIIYAPPGTGKGFAERIIDMMFEILKIRDYVQQAREDIYLAVMNRKGQNEKAPEDPHTTLRLIPPKNSEAEFLETMRDNCGYHMFTYAAEMDSWAKGVKAAGGNKDDMIRIAWDNGEYGQQYKSASTFKGVVRLYWNVLITGTVQQLFHYFKNVENGLITRCSFTTIENQEYAPPPIWKEMNKREKETIRKYMERCDRNSYVEPCEILMEDVDTISPDKFDEEINWRFTFQKRKTVDLDWLRPTIDKFLEEQMKLASVNLDKARDVFRRRVAVRGFRLGLLCYSLWENPKPDDLKKCIPFIEWWMNQDIESTLKLWGARYNNEVQSDIQPPQKSIFSALPQAFTKGDVYTQCVRSGVKTPVRNILSLWLKQGYIKKLSKEEFEKIYQMS